MRMGRVLALVAGALVFFIAALGLAVYFTRDEDNLQADNLLAENFTKAVTLAPQNDDRVVLPDAGAVRVGSRPDRPARHAPRGDLAAARPRVDRDRHRRRRRPAALPARTGRSCGSPTTGVRTRSRASSARSPRSPREDATFSVRDRRDPGPDRRPSSACRCALRAAFWACVFLRALALACILCLCGPSLAQARAGELGLGNRAARVAQDEPAHHAEADDQHAADDEEDVAAGRPVVGGLRSATVGVGVVAGRRAEAGRRRPIALPPRRGGRGRAGW